MADSASEDEFVDQFGFISPSPVLNSHNLLRDNARLEKWQDMLSRWEFMKRSRKDKIKKRARKGIPNCLRGKVWYDLAKCEECKEDHPPDLYNTLNTSDYISQFDEQIKRDVYRTFPKHVLFREEAGQHTLYRVLRAYSLYDRETGYCQGMGFITGVFLMYMPEEQAFWMLISLMTKYKMKGFFIQGMPSIYSTIYTCHELGKQVMPRLFKHLEEQQLSASLYATNWFMTLFSCCLPMEVVLRVWDSYFCEGPKVLYRMYLGVLKLADTNCALKKQDFEEALTNIQDTSQSITGDSLFRAAFSFHLSKNQIDQLDKAFRAQGNPRFLSW